MPLTVVEQFTSMPEAQIAASVLESAGIVAVVMDGPSIALNPLAQMRGGYRLAVSEDDLDKANDERDKATAAFSDGTQIC